MTINEYFSKKSKKTIVIIGLMLFVILGFVDHFTWWEYSFSVFYLVPIMFVVWFTKSRTLGILMTIIGGIVWLLADVTAGHVYSQKIIPFWNTLVRLGFFYISVFLLLRLIKALEKEKEMSRTDSLTKISNSRHFFEILNYEKNKMIRNNLPITIAYVDIDNFKAVNDMYGHNIDDNLLYIVANTIKDGIRKTDTVARIGGGRICNYVSGNSKFFNRRCNRKG